MIEDYGVRDDQVERAVFAFPQGGAALAHSVADHFSAPESDLVPVVGKVFFDLDDEIGVRKADAVAFRGTE
jgi:hypothetical protein